MSVDPSQINGHGWFGGVLPAMMVAIVVAPGNLRSALQYPIAFAAFGFMIVLVFLPETKDRNIETMD